MSEEQGKEQFEEPEIIATYEKGQLEEQVRPRAELIGVFYP